MPRLFKNILDFHAWAQLSGLDLDGVLNDSFGVIEHNLKTTQGETIS
jgi:hypothetical protein